MLVSQAAVLTTVHAETTDEKIAAQDSKISNLTSQQKEAQKQVDEIQTQVTAIQTQQTNLEAENETLQAESKNLKEKLQSSLRTLLLVMNLWKNKHVAHKQTVLQLATSIQL